jgi:transposase-like protein
MPRVRFVLPQVKAQPQARPTSCPYCGGSILQRHGETLKPLRDLYLHQVTVFRYRCADCSHTFRHYPPGVDHHDQSQRLRALAALLWALGLSHQNISYLLTALGPTIAKMTSWRDVQEAGVALQRGRGRTGVVEVIGADETVVKVQGQQMVLDFVVDPATGELLGLDLLVEQDAQAFIDWLRPYVERHGVQVAVTDDLATYKPVLEELGLGHQVCLAHVRKNVTRRLKDIDGWVEAKEKIKALMKDLPRDGGRELLELEKEVRGAAKLRELVVDLCEKWRSMVCYQGRLGVPGTNNRTEQGIGRSKVRYKTLRGYKSVAGMLNGLRLTQWVWRPKVVGDLAALVAARG